MLFSLRQLEGLVRERHDAFARLRTAEDLLEAVRAENAILHQNVTLSQAHTGDPKHGNRE